MQYFFLFGQTISIKRGAFFDLVKLYKCHIKKLFEFVFLWYGYRSPNELNLSIDITHEIDLYIEITYEIYEWPSFTYNNFPWCLHYGKISIA